MRRKGMPCGECISGSEQIETGNGQETFDASDLEVVRSMFGVKGRVLPVPGCTGYAVSECGRVFSRAACRWRRDERLREIRRYVDGNGYYRVTLTMAGKGRSKLVHRFVALAFLPPPAAGQKVVRHLDGNPISNHVTNLAWGTQADNMRDCVRHGRTLKGIKNPNAKLNGRRAALIRGLDAEGFSQRAIAAFFDVNPETIRRVCSGEGWGADQPVVEGGGL